jgi:hypothetical protein
MEPASNFQYLHALLVETTTRKVHSLDVVAVLFARKWEVAHPRSQIQDAKRLCIPVKVEPEDPAKRLENPIVDVEILIWTERAYFGGTILAEMRTPMSNQTTQFRICERKAKRVRDI